MRVVMYRTNEGVKPAVVGEPGTKWTRLVMIDVPMRLVKVANSEARFMRDAPGIKLKKAATDMLRIGRRLGITDGARDLLREAKKA